MKRKYVLIKLSPIQLEDIRSAVDFTARDYESCRKDKAPRFMAGLKSARKKLWTKDVIDQSRKCRE